MSAGKIKTLICCVCGESTKGRQWFNRDTGYGICEPCIVYVKQHGESDEEIRSNYGIEGTHYGPFESDDSKVLRNVLGEALRHTCQTLEPNASVPYSDGPCDACAKEKAEVQS